VKNVEDFVDDPEAAKKAFAKYDHEGNLRDIAELMSKNLGRFLER